MCIDNGGICAKLHRLLSKGEISKGKSLLLNREDIRIFDDESVYAFEIYIFSTRIIISYPC